jgi:hypothetical protein
VIEMSVAPRAADPPRDPAAQLQWLVDRAAISDRLIDFARCLDVRDWSGYVENFTDDAELELPHGTFEGRAQIAELATRGLDDFDATHHLSANHVIEIDGDEARTRSYVSVAHVPDASAPTEHGDAGGWYDCRLRRVGDGWRFTRVSLQIVWIRGTAFPH